MLVGSEVGCGIISECVLFDGRNMVDLQRKLKVKTIEDVLREFSGDDLIIDKTSMTSNQLVRFNSNFTTESEETLRKLFSEFNTKY